MALNTIEEERKRKEAAQRLAPTTDPFLAAIARGEGMPVRPVVKQAKPTPSNIMNESFYGGSVDIDTLRRLNKQDQTTTEKVNTVSTSEPKTSKLYEAPTALRVPTLKELPNAQRDTELGKMNVGTNGNIVTYDIGGNTLSYDATKTDPSKISLRNINSQPSNSQPTWDDYHKQQAERYDAYVNSPRGRYFGPAQLPTEEKKDNSLGGLFLQGLQMRKDRANAQIANDLATQETNRMKIEADAENDANRNLLFADQNRINEMDVQGQNKYREIEGQVAQNPPIKESALKPMVVKEYDELGNVVGERIKIPNAEGTGYVDGMGEQSTFVTPKPATVEKMLKMRDSKDPNLAAAEAEYKRRFGNLPY